MSVAAPCALSSPSAPCVASDTQGPATLSLRVQSIAWETEQIQRFELRSVDGGPLPAFTAGAHVTLHLPGGMQRSYSLLNPPNEQHRYVLGIARDRASRGGSRHLHERVRVGERLTVTPPRNLFELDETASHAVLIGGGIGITPLLSMAARLQAIGADWRLHYAVRSRSDLAFTEVLASLGERVRLHIDEEAGALLDLPDLVAQAPAGAHFYCCGPSPMLKAFEQATAAITPSRVHVEHFAPAKPPATGGGFTLELARSGRSVDVPEGMSIIDALNAAGISAATSCLQGVCGVCETRVLAGRPDHRDAVLSPAERTSNSTMMICCSGSLDERLVLDL